MSITAAPFATAALSPSVFHRRPLASTHPLPAPHSHRGRLCYQVALTTAVPSSEADEVAATEAKVGSRIRLKMPLKVYYVSKAHQQFVKLWKGKSISANMPFKVEFLLSVDGQPKTVKVLNLRITICFVKSWLESAETWFSKSTESQFVSY